MAKNHRKATLVRINVHIGQGQHDKLFKISEKVGLSVAEMLRRALDTYIQRYADTGKT
jgi:hypothetical protein